MRPHITAAGAPSRGSREFVVIPVRMRGRMRNRIFRKSGGVVDRGHLMNGAPRRYNLLLTVCNKARITHEEATRALDVLFSDSGLIAEVLRGGKTVDIEGFGTLVEKEVVPLAFKKYRGHIAKWVNRAAHGVSEPLRGSGASYSKRQAKTIMVTLDRRKPTFVREAPAPVGVLMERDFEEFVMRMQKPDVRKAMTRAYNSTSQKLGEAAVNAAQALRGK